MIDWSKCPDVESVPGRCGGAWVAKDSRVMVEGILDNAEYDQTPLQIARMFSLHVAAVRKVLAFAYASELHDLLTARLAGNWSRESAYRFDRRSRQLAELDRALKRGRKPPR